MTAVQAPPAQANCRTSKPIKFRTRSAPSSLGTSRRAIFWRALLMAVACFTGVAGRAAGRDLSRSPADLVNPLMGTDSAPDLSWGNTYPAIAVPWGMNFWTPMTAKAGDGWTYKYDDTKIRGFKQTHQPSPWMNDYGAFALMATTGKLQVGEDERASWFSHKAETARPYSYRVYLASYDVTAEIAPTERAAVFRFTFPETGEANIILDAFAGGSEVVIDSARRRITGLARNNSGGVPKGFATYFVAEFDKPFATSSTWLGSTAPVQGRAKIGGDHAGAAVGFATRRGEVVTVRVASSFISPEQAELNLRREVGTRGYEEVAASARSAWNKLLGRVRVSDPDVDRLRTFYSCLYRVLLFPRPLAEIDGRGRTVHWSPFDGKVHAGPLYTDNGFWDTWRAVFPYLTWMHPGRTNDIMQGLANTYKESGWLPEWASPGHRDIMIGSNSAIIIADAWVKGLRSYDVDTLYEAVLKNARTTEGRPTQDNGDLLASQKLAMVVRSVGREGVEYYNQLGYVPYDVGINESAARTLEYATADFALSRFAAGLGHEADAKLFAQRAGNYRRLYDPSVGWMRGRNRDGRFQSPFNPLKWGDAFTEGNSLHYSWSVFQDVQGLIDLMGGDKAFAGKLDSVFSMPPTFDDSYYGGTIHEIREMQVAGMGNYAHGNQPIQHMIYLYDHAGQPWKAQDRLRTVSDKLYSAAPDGYPGDEDNGQTSAWYVFTALGFYPVSPATGQYVIGAPQFQNAEITMENGRTLKIEAPEVSSENRYIQSASLGGKPLDRTWLTHDELLAGGTLRFRMGPKPNVKWAQAGPRPFSMSSPQASRPPAH